MKRTFAVVSSSGRTGESVGISVLTQTTSGKFEQWNYYMDAEVAVQAAQLLTKAISEAASIRENTAARSV